MKTLHKEVWLLSRFGIVGVVTNASLYVLFVVLVRFGMSPVTTAGFCYILGAALSYVLNRHWTFRSSHEHRGDLPKFFLAYGVGAVSTLVTIGVLVRWLSPELAQILNIGITAAVIYICLRLFRFGRGPAHAN